MIKFFISILLLSGCATMSGIPVNIQQSSQVIGTELTANVGQKFFDFENMTGEDNHYGSVYNGNANRFELEVKSVSKNKLILQYTEFMKPVNGNGGYHINEPWVAKPAFTKTIDFDISGNNVIEYGKYKFEIIKCENNKVIYKRVR